MILVFKIGKIIYGHTHKYNLKLYHKNLTYFLILKLGCFAKASYATRTLDSILLAFPAI